MTDGHLREHFDDLGKQTHAARLGMWTFIASEALLFSGLFALYAAYRVAFGTAFGEAVRETNLVLGAAMTMVLVTSSYAVAMGLGAVREARPGAGASYLAGAIALGLLFLVLKGTEYAQHFSHGIFPGQYYRYEPLETEGASVFFTLYYFMTGLHALHVIGGVAVLGWLWSIVRRGRLGPDYDTPFELGAIFWHFVDVVWLFLWPIFYLLR